MENDDTGPIETTKDSLVIMACNGLMNCVLLVMSAYLIFGFALFILIIHFTPIDLFTSRILNAVIGPCALLLYWRGCRIRRKDPHSTKVFWSLRVGKIYMFLMAVNGYITIHDNLFYNYYIMPDKAFNYMHTFYAVVLIAYVLISTMIRKKFAS